jgi:hypothetical protein
MKAILVLTAACLPLAALTISSFVELAAIEEEVLVQTAGRDLRSIAIRAKGLQEQAQTERHVSDQLSAAEFLAGEPRSAFDWLPDGSSLRLAAGAWTDWIHARELVDGYFQAERLTTSADADQVEKAKSQMATLAREYGDAALPARWHFLKLVDQRTAELEAQLPRLRRLADARQRLDRAWEAFQAQEHDRCVKLCEELTKQYADVLETAELARVKMLCERARFWDDVKLLNRMLEAAASPIRRKTILESFLNRYSSMDGRTTSEQRILDRCTEQLGQVVEAISAEERKHRAEEEIDALTAELPSSFGERLARASRVLDLYSDAHVREQLQKNVVVWLDEFVPAKAIQEPRMLQEAESTRGEIIRGFFREDTGPDGNLIGYKHYRKYEQFVNPTSEVGTYRIDQLRSPPTVSVPRRCMEAYNEARTRLLNQLTQEDAWSEFADLCEKLEAQILEYRKKPGSSREALSFEREAEFARSTSTGPAMQSFQGLFGD